MKEKKLIEIYFNKYRKGKPIDFHGIKLHINHEPIIKESFNKILIEIENPKDLPFRVKLIEYAFVDDFHDFMKIAGMTSDSWLRDVGSITMKYFIIKIDSDYENYIPSSLVKKINEVGNQKHSFGWGNDYKIHYRLKKIKFERSYVEEIDLTGLVYDIELLKSNVKMTDIQIHNFFKSQYSGDNMYDLNSELFWPIKEIFYDYPTFFDASHDYFQIASDMVDSKGKEIKYWEDD